MSNAIKDTVSTLLQTAGITFSAVYRGEVKNALWGNTTMDEWACHFVHSSRPMEPVSFAFFTGLGLRAQPTEHDKAQARMSLRDLTAKDIEQRTIYGRRYFADIEASRKPASPHAADVLYSVMMDARACNQSFSDWCNEYGYDTDSRKAHAIYEACQNTGDKLRRFIPAGLLWSDLETALQDY